MTLMAKLHVKKEVDVCKMMIYKNTNTNIRPGTAVLLLPPEELIVQREEPSHAARKQHVMGSIIQPIQRVWTLRQHHCFPVD